MVDGYVLVEVSDKGKIRVKDNEVFFFDLRLERSFDDDEICQQIIDSFSFDETNVLIMVFFNYKSEEFFSTSGTEGGFEHLFIIESTKVIQKNYKDFYRKSIEHIVQSDIGGFEYIDHYKDEFSFNEENDNFYKEIIKDWESLYDESFKVTQS